MTEQQQIWSDPQWQAIESRGQNVIVSAGAGSGKTSVLVERVVRCVLEEVNVDLTKLLVVTFTEAAAAEMRKRIGDRLEALRTDAESNHDETMSRRLSRLRGQLEQAQISTLHSFCMQVVRQNYLYLELEPGFGILAEEDGLLLRQSCLYDVIESQLSGERAVTFRTMMDLLGIADPLGLRRLVFRLDTFSRSQQSPRAWLESMRAQYTAADGQDFDELPWTSAFATWCLRRLEAAIEEFQSALEIASTVPELDAYSTNLATALPLVSEAFHALQSRQWDEVANLLGPVISCKSPRAKTDDPAKERVQQLRKHALSEVSAVFVVLARGRAALKQDVVAVAPAVSTLVDLVLNFQEVFLSAKREQGVLDFNDLEHFAYEVLMDEKTGEAQRLQAQFAEIFVDEFQDTSPIQDALVAAVARPHGNVFVVGDVKQSIYRFRMAQPALFLDKYNQRVTGAPFQAVDLLENYRSRRAVVNAVNQIFSQLFSEEFGGAAYDHGVQMHHGARYPEIPADEPVAALSGPVEVHLLEREVDARNRFSDGAGNVPEAEMGPSAQLSEADQSPPNEELAGQLTAQDNQDAPGTQAELVSPEDVLSIEREARVMAQRIGALMGLHGETPKQVWDTRRQAYRPLQFRDIVILLRSVKGRVSPIIEVFQEYGIPAYGITSTGFYSALEIQWLLAALATIDNPRREIELVATMRSPIGEFTDGDLAQIRLAHAGNFFEAVRAVAKSEQLAGVGTDLRDRVRRFLKRVNGWRLLARRARTEDVLQRLLDDTGLFDYTLAMSGGRVRAANMQTLMERARAFDKVSVDGVYGFVNHARDLVQSEVDLGEARTLAEAENVVRLMTIHQSKGLEFPVVIVADLGKRFYRDPLERSLPLHRTMGFGPQRIDIASDQRWQTVPSIAIDEAETVEFLAEEARILYVAITRAREQLILIGSARGLWKRIDAAGRTAEAATGAFSARLLLGGNSTLDWLLAVLWRHPDGKAELSRYLSSYVSELPEVKLVESHGAAYDTRIYDEQASELGTNAGQTNRAQGDAGAAASTNRHVSGLRHALSQPGLALDTLVNWLGAVEAQQRVDDGEAAHDGEAAPDLNSIQLEIIEDVADPGPPAKVSATDLRRLWAARHLADSALRIQFATRATAERLLDEPAWVAKRKPSGRERGTAFHRVMHFIELTVSPSEAAVAQAIRRALEPYPDRDDTLQGCEPIDVVRFLESPLGAAVRRANRVMREQPFFHRIEIPGTAGGEFVTVQGVMDLLVELPDKWLLIDYKTDAISADATREAAAEYAAQISVYLDVAQSVLGAAKPIEAWLYFVQPGVGISLDPVDYRTLFEQA